MSFSFGQKSFFGLDISDFSLKIAQLEKEAAGFKVIAFGQEKIPAGLIQKGEIQQVNVLAKLIKKALQNIKGRAISTHNVVCSLPEEKSFLDILQLPVVATKEELEGLVASEAENRIPFPLAEVYFGFEQVELVSPSTTLQEVLLAAAPRKVVDSYFQVLSQADLKPLVMEVESLALARALFKKDVALNPVLVIDFGGSRTSFVIYAGKNVRFTSTISASSMKLTQDIVNSLRVSPERAEKLKIKEGLTGSTKLLEAMMPGLTDLAERIKNHLSYYHTHVPKNKFSYNSKELEKVVLCGGGAGLKGLATFLTKELKVRVELGNPLLNINKARKTSCLKLHKEEALAYTTALGLAQRKVYGN